MIEYTNIRKSFGKFTALHGIDLNFKLGQVVALIGPNGSGKTTLIKCLLDMVLPSEGEIRFNGKSIQGESDYRKQIGYMPQIGRYPDSMSVRQLFDLMKNVRKDVEAKEYDLDLFNAFEIESIYGKRLNNLSGGMKQKINVALAFLFNPKVLLLDEPTAGLDPISNEVLKKKLQQTAEENRLIIITSHILSDLEDLTTDVVYIFEGKVLFYDSLQELKSESKKEKLNQIVAYKLNQIERGQHV